MPDTSKAKAADTKVAANANPDPLLQRADAARQRNLARRGDSEWTLKISLSLVPSSGNVPPGDDEHPTDPHDDEHPTDPHDDEHPTDPHSGATIVAHAPIELRGAEIQVRFAAHAAEKTPRAKPAAKTKPRTGSAGQRGRSRSTRSSK